MLLTICMAQQAEEDGHQAGQPHLQSKHKHSHNTQAKDTLTGDRRGGRMGKTYHEYLQSERTQNGRFTEVIYTLLSLLLYLSLSLCLSRFLSLLVSLSCPLPLPLRLSRSLSLCF